MGISTKTVLFVWTSSTCKFITKRSEFPLKIFEFHLFSVKKISERF